MMHPHTLEVDETFLPLLAADWVTLMLTLQFLVHFVFRWKAALALEEDMRRHRVGHNAYTLTSCISALANAGKWEEAVQVPQSPPPPLCPASHTCKHAT